MRMSRNLIPAFLLLAILSGGSGCTLIGYGIGSGVDSSNKRMLTLAPDSALSRIDEGDVIICGMRDGTYRSGVYDGKEASGESCLLKLSKEEGSQSVVLADVAAISFHARPVAGRSVFTALGLVIDAAIVISAASQPPAQFIEF